MPSPILLPLGLVAAGIYLLSRDDKLSAQPEFTPGAKDQFTEMRTLSDGTAVRYFRSEIVNGLMAAFSQKGLDAVQVQGQSPGLLFKVVNLQGVMVTAQAAVQLANAQGMVVLGSLSLVVPDPTVDKLIMIVSPSQRGVANSASQFAVLLDAGQPGQSLPVPATLPGQKDPFDPNMPAVLVQEVNASLSDPNADPDGLDLQADALEKAGFPIAAKALRDRAATIRVQRQMKNVKAGGTPFHIRGSGPGGGGLAVDLPFHTAEHYTGDGNRWREIASVNTKLGMVVTPKGLDPWHSNLDILLPLAWDCDSKPLPRPLGVPSKAAGKTIYWNHVKEQWVDENGNVSDHQAPAPSSKDERITRPAVAGVDYDDSDDEPHANGLAADA
jgi:hypothetical protein